MDGHTETVEKPPKPSRTARLRRKMIAVYGEVQHLQSLAETLLGHLEAAIRPDITDADRICYRRMIQEIRDELRGNDLTARPGFRNLR